MSKNKKNKEDILLKRAFEEYCDRMGDALAEDEGLKDELPPNDEDRLYYLKAVRRKERSSAALKVLKRVAAIVLAAVSVTFAALMMDENVRAAVTRSIVRFFDDGVRISFRDPDDTGNENGERKTTDDVTFGYVPEGLAVEELHDDQIPNNRYVRFGAMNDVFDTIVVIDIFPTDEVNPGFSKLTWDNKVYLSEINGMDAFMVDVEFELHGKTSSVRGITFGDGDISIMMTGINISSEELIRVAENIVW